MRTAKSKTLRKIARSIVLGSFLLALAAFQLLAQDAGDLHKKPTPAKIESQLVLVDEAVVLEQWTHTLKLVNAPQSTALLNPGQCIRVGIVATGDNRDEFIANTKVSFRVKFSGQEQDHPLAPLAQIKQIKPDGGDFVTQALGAAGIKNPMLTMATMGVSAENWCVPADAQDGTATAEADVESPGGHHRQAPSKIQIESFETGSRRSFKSEEEMEEFSMTYHSHPNPARLFAVLQFFAADQKDRENRGTPESTAAFIGSALKNNPLAAKDFMNRVSTQTGFTRGFGLMTLLFAGYDIDPALQKMSEDDRKKFAGHPNLPDPDAMSADGENATRLDMLWGVFMATGQFAPIEKIAQTLAWRSDWDALNKLRSTPNHPTDWTPSIARAVTYGAAGWSLSSFQRTDPLAADFIQYMLASPDTPPNVKAELGGLSTNPAFQGK